MKDLMQGKKAVILCAGCEGSKRIGRNLSDHHVLLCEVRLVGVWIKRREVNGPQRISNDKLRVHKYMEGYSRCQESKSRMG